MLVVARKIGERVKVGDSTWITVVDIKKGVIRLGIDAPRGMLILREELINAGGETDEVSRQAEGHVEAQETTATESPRAGMDRAGR